uniref:Uncharacterized protein n=1 Tax=Syphacia muris TaxID=451379 RepID=A0A0N5ACW1_9BILA
MISKALKSRKSFLLHWMQHFHFKPLLPMHFKYYVNANSF